MLFHEIKDLFDFLSCEIEAIPKFRLFLFRKTTEFDLAFDLSPGLERSLLFRFRKSQAFVGEHAFDQSHADAPGPDATKAR